MHVDTQICPETLIFTNGHCTNKFGSDPFTKPKPIALKWLIKKKEKNNFGLACRNEKNLHWSSKIWDKEINLNS